MWLACVFIEVCVESKIQPILPVGGPPTNPFKPPFLKILSGDGCVAFRREKYVDMGGPSGGTGGGGGSIYLKCDQGLNTLAGLRSKVGREGAWKA
jgi:hypothetical protein